MPRNPLLWRALAALLVMSQAMSVSARVLTLSKQSETTAIVRDAVDGDTATTALVNPPARLLVEVGVVAADIEHDLVYVGASADPAGPAAGDPGTLLVGTYGNTPLPAGTLNAPTGRAFVALVFDAPASRLIGVVVDPSGDAVAQVFTAATNGGSAIGVPTWLDTAAGCCSFVSGIATWRSTTQELFMVGRRDGDIEDQLLRFDIGSGTALPDAYPIVGDRVVALAVDAQDGSVYALARSVLDFSYLASVTYAAPGAPATLSAIGSAPAACCYVAAGPATIDGSGAERALYALTRDAETPVSMQLSRFDLISGNPLVVNAAVEGFGLWSDPGAALDRIFADGFD